MGNSLQSLNDPAEPGGSMTIRQTQQDRVGSVDVLAHSGTPDQNGFRYAARCMRWEFPHPRWSCNLQVADDMTGVDYARALYYIPDNADLWIVAKPLPQAFVDFALDMRRLVECLATPAP